jgi:hypothetical protein
MSYVSCGDHQVLGGDAEGPSLRGQDHVAVQGIDARGGRTGIPGLPPKLCREFEVSVGEREVTVRNRVAKRPEPGDLARRVEALQFSEGFVVADSRHHEPVPGCCAVPNPTMTSVEEGRCDAGGRVQLPGAAEREGIQDNDARHRLELPHPQGRAGLVHVRLELLPELVLPGGFLGGACGALCFPLPEQGERWVLGVRFCGQRGKVVRQNLTRKLRRRHALLLRCCSEPSLLVRTEFDHQAHRHLASPAMILRSPASCRVTMVGGFACVCHRLLIRSEVPAGEHLAAYVGT